MSDETLGEMLGRLRSQKGCGLVWASQGVGMSPSELSKCERGYANPSLKLLHAIATFYATDVDNLIALAATPPPTLGKMSIHIAGASDISGETVAALIALAKAVAPTIDPQDANDFRELEAFWPDMVGLEDGVDIFLAQYGPPTGVDANDADATYLAAQAGSISGLCNDYTTALALGDGSGTEFA